MKNTKVIKFREAISCMEGSYAAGEIKELDVKFALPWIKSGQAEDLTPPAVTEVSADDEGVDPGTTSSDSGSISETEATEVVLNKPKGKNKKK